ncbi:nucleoside-diphosphate kinase [Bacteroidetes/Chlorobi group bacterium ChocPot_Mid]|jgi:nucleoside-diphosphate kinase|nr:MAG: nucleoside-diphosphate kinase [Bacteroidetes/Chlorobi group bacterium ChocPot_Mid]
MKERTLAIIKPDAVKKNVIGEIIAMITKAGFSILAMRMTKLSVAQASAFYEVHKERPFYGELVDYMCSGKVVAIALEKENAIEDYRKLIGSTDPKEAAEGTVRKLYGESKSFNAVHGSDSAENGIREIGFFFAECEIVNI